MAENYKIVVVGGGTAGITATAKLLKKYKPEDICLIEPADIHYYQPLWTLVGSGLKDLSQSHKPMADVMPKGIKWLKDKVSSFDPENNKVTTSSGKDIAYSFLVVCPGLQLRWDMIKGLEGNLGKNGICSNYSSEYVESTFANVKSMKSGKSIFTMPQMPIKCPGAPQKAMWLSEDYWTTAGVRNNIDVKFVSAGASIFGVERYRIPLEKLIVERNINTSYGTNLISVDAENKKATFVDVNTKEESTMDYDMLHVVPPQSTPEFLRSSSIVNEGGFVDVDRNSLQHNKYKNIFSLGDASGSPNSKTGAAVKNQAPVVAANIFALDHNKPLVASYNGYASCPLTTRANRCILAEFGYDGAILETFPFNQNKERYSMSVMKKTLLPFIYWEFLLKGMA